MAAEIDLDRGREPAQRVVVALGTKNAVSARLFSAAIACIVASASQGSSGHTAAGLPPNSAVGEGIDLIERQAFIDAAALDGVAFGAPAQHAAGEVGDVAEPRLLQDHGRLRRAAAGAAHRDDRPVARQFAGALGQLAERDQHRARRYGQAGR